METIGYLHLNNAIAYYHGDMCLHFSIFPIPKDWDSKQENLDSLIPQDLTAEKLGVAWRVLTPEDARNATYLSLGNSLTHNVALMAPTLAVELTAVLWEIIHPVIAFSNSDFDFRNKRIRSFHDLFPKKNGTTLALLLIGKEKVGVFIAHVPD